MVSHLRRLLLVSQHFPPSAEVAGKPTARLVRYLEQVGWKTTVLTISQKDIVGPLDHRAYADVLRAARIERVARWPHVLDLVRFVRSVANRASSSRKPSTTQDVASPFSWAPSSGLRSRVVRYLAFPDKSAGWVAPAVLRARQILAEERFDAVLTVSPPHSSHMVGLAIRRLEPSLPWIAQLHDPWVDFDGVGHPDWLLRRASGYLERQVLSMADDVLLATEEAATRYAARYPELPPGKYGVLANGYDATDFPAIEPPPRAAGRPLEFVHLGTIYGGRNPLPFLRGIASLIASGVLDPGSVKIDLVGDCDPTAAVERAISECGLERVVTIHRPVDHSEALRRMMTADVLLLLAQEQPHQIPAKLYEYLNANRFVLAFAEGGSARVIEQTGAGRVVGPGDDVPAVLREIVDMHRSGRLALHSVAHEKLRPYQARHLAEVLASRLNALLQSVRSPQGRTVAG
jgi:glycosyltransferase involved in cell wall biosynthesis